MSNPRIFYTSDLHISHNYVAGTRMFVQPDSPPPYLRPDPKAHDVWLADLWDSTVRPIDSVFVLGDMSINGGQQALDWIEARPGKKILVAGNHDPVHPEHYREYHKKIHHWLNYFDTISPYFIRKLNGVKIALSHFPYSGTGAEGHGVEERYTQWRLPDVGMPLLHGHTHGKEQHHVSDNGTPQLHVGIDAWKRLLPQEEVIEWIKEKVL